MTNRESTGGLSAALGAALLASGSFLLYQGLSRGLSGSSSAQSRAEAGAPQGLEVNKSITIARPAAELYGYWRNFENLPAVMRHLKSVTPQEGGRSSWVAQGPLGTQVSWDAEITEDTENERIAWRSLEGAAVPNEGAVVFKKAPGSPGDRGTELHVSLTYQPPLGPVGAAFAKLFGEEPGQQLQEDLRRFKQVMETGEIATTRGQSAGR